VAGVDHDVPVSPGGVTYWRGSGGPDGWTHEGASSTVRGHRAVGRGRARARTLEAGLTGWGRPITAPAARGMVSALLASIFHVAEVVVGA
jgi:hypothetical protein